MTIEMNHDLITVQRNSYNFFDMLSDVGGVHTAIYAVLGAILAIFNYKNFDNYMASRLFKIKNKDMDSKKVQIDDEFDLENDNNLPIIPTKCCNFSSYLHDLLPEKLKKVCKSSRRTRATRKAHKFMATEINIIEIVKWIRYSRMALKLLMTKKEQV